VAKKLNLRFILLYFWYLWGWGLVENVIWGRGWLKTSEYWHIEGEGYKIAQKNVI